MNGATSSIAVSSAVRQQHVGTKSVALRNRYIRNVATILMVGAILMLAFVWTRVRVIQFGYEVTKLHRDVADLDQERARIQARISALKSPERLERVARENFHMRLPLGSELVYVGP